VLFGFSQKNVLVPFEREVVIANYPMDAGLTSYFQLTEFNNFRNKLDSTKTVHIYPPLNYPFDYHVQPAVVDSSLLTFDTLKINGCVGELFYKKLKHFTFLNPGNDVVDQQTWEIPLATAYYQNPSRIQVDDIYFKLKAQELTAEPLSNFVQPFFIKNYEVTNFEYRQFVDYVKDSIGREILSEEIDSLVYSKIITYDSLGEELPEEEWLLNYDYEIDWRKTEDNEEFISLAQLFLGESDRYYNRLELDTRKMRYKYYNDADSTLNWINIYPDTTVWVSDFAYQDIEAYTEMYFWHPAFDSYPVVGITYWQAVAYTHWLTKKLKKQYKEIGIERNVSIQLPSIAQWNFASKKKLEKMGSVFEKPFSWETDLYLNESYTKPQGESHITDWDKSRQLQKATDKMKTVPKSFWDSLHVIHRTQTVLNNDLFLLSPKYSYYRTFDLYTKYNEEPKKIKENDIMNIQNLGSNVSEWLMESYEDNWQKLYYKRMELLVKTAGLDADIQALKEEYFNYYNQQDGAMVIGANWFDYRDEFLKGENTDCHQTKTFPSKDSSFSTVGFRYVIVFDE